MGPSIQACQSSPTSVLAGRMGWSVLLLASLLAGPVLLQPVEQADLEEQEQMRELFLSVFIDNHRSARDLDAEEEDGEARAMEDEEEDTTNLVEEDEDEDEAETAVEVVSSSDPQEIARFNNYMDAIYRRMNAALRAKLMDPMVLNMNPKEKKKRVERAVERSVDLEEIDEDEDEVDRMGEIEEAEEKDKEAKKLARKEKKKKRKNKRNKKDKKDKKERKKELSPE